MKIAYVALSAHGHVFTSVPMVGELIRRGVDVDYYATLNFRDQVVKSGANFHELPSEGGTGDSVENNGDFTEIIPLIFLGMAKGTVAALVEQMKSNMPDVIITDSFALAGRLAASFFNIPLIYMFTSFASGEPFSIRRTWPEYDPKTSKPRAMALELAKELQAEYGGKLLTCEEIFDSWADYNIVTVTRSFQPEGDKFPSEKYFFAGAQIAERAGGGSWQRPTNGKPLLYTSLGTLFNNWPEFYRMLFEAVKDLDINVLCSLGKTLKPDMLGEIPSNVTTTEFAPQLEVLEHADCFITHAGIGSSMEAMYFGVPCLAIPQMDEQAFAAHRMLEFGLASASLTKSQVTAEALRENLLKLINDPAYKENCNRQKEEMRTKGGAANAADAVIRYVNRL